LNRRHFFSNAAARQRTVDAWSFSRHFRAMKTGPSLLLPAQHGLLVLVSSVSLMVVAGCASKPKIAKQAPYPPPHVVGVDEIMQRDAVKTRTRELIDSGKYKNSADARRAAEKENPPVVDSTNSGLQEAEYYRWKQQQEVQSKFESDLEKMNRKS
jgi:hypothetical protein